MNQSRKEDEEKENFIPWEHYHKYKEFNIYTNKEKDAIKIKIPKEIWESDIMISHTIRRMHHIISKYEFDGILVKNDGFIDSFIFTILKIAKLEKIDMVSEIYISGKEFYIAVNGVWPT